MTGVHKALNLTQSDAGVEALSAEPCHNVLEPSPPDYVERMSRYLGSSVGQSKHDKASNDPAEAESDSGDSLFITQNPVPEAVRSGRRRRHGPRSHPTSPKDLEEHEDDSSSSTSSSTSHGDSKTDERRRKKKIRLPKYSFPFLSKRKWRPRSTRLTVQQNTTLHNSTMGGFFKCVRELWQGYQRGDDLASSLPTVDMEGEYISPLSEEEEKSESEDIKVVERKSFVAPLKAKRSQSWYVPENRDGRVKQQRWTRTSNARQQMSPGSQKKMLHKIPARESISRFTALSSDTESSDTGNPSCQVLTERETSDKNVTSNRVILAQTETQKTKRSLSRGNKNIFFQGEESGEDLCNDSDATVCEQLELRGSSGEYTLDGREVSPNVTMPQDDVVHTDDQSQMGQSEAEPESQSLLQNLQDLESEINNDWVQNETRVKNTKKEKGDNESAEVGKGQSQEEPEGLYSAASVKVEAEETPSLCEDNQKEPLASQPSDELERNEKNRMENSSHEDILLRQEGRPLPHSKKIKKKRTNVRQEEEENLESEVRLEKDSLLSVTCNMVNRGNEKRKKKMNRSMEDDEGVEQLHSSTVSQLLSDDAETERKTEKRKKQKIIVNIEEHEKEEALDMNLDLPLMSKGLLEELRNGLESTEASHDDVQVSAEDVEDLSLSKDVTFEGQSAKKKKGRSAEDDERIEQLQSSTVSQLLNDAEPPGKKKKRKKQKIIVNTEEQGLDNTEASHDDARVKADDVEDLRLSKDVTFEGHTGRSAKKRKKKRNRSMEDDEGVEQLHSNTVSQHLKDDAVPERKTKKGKKQKIIVNIEEHEKEEALDMNLDLPLMSKGLLEELRNGLESTEASHDDVQVSAEDVEDLSLSKDVTFEGHTGQSAKKRKKKRNRRMEDDEGVEQLQSSTVSQHLNDDAEPHRKKKMRKKQKIFVNTEECEEEGALFMNLDLPQVSKRPLEEIGNGLENTEVSQEILDSTSEKKRKKHKKKQLSASHQDAQVRAEDVVDLNTSKDTTFEGCTGWSVKKKKKKKKREGISEEVDISCTPDKNNKVNNTDDSQKTKDSPYDQDAELVTKKKKKKKSEIFSSNVSEDTVAQSDDLASVQKKEKKGTSSFLVADAGEKNVQMHEEQSSPFSKPVEPHVWGLEKPSILRPNQQETKSAGINGNFEISNDGSRKKKRKRKLTMKESVQDFEEQNETFKSALSESTDIGVKRIMKHKRNESELVTPMERLESAAHVGYSQTDEGMVLKKKKKKKRKDETCCEIQENPPNTTDDAELEEATLKPCSSVLPKKKDKRLTFPLVAKEKHGQRTDITYDAGTSDKETKEILNTAEHASPSIEIPRTPVLNDRRDKKKKKRKSTDIVFPEGKSLTKSAEIETQNSIRKEKMERNKPTAVPSFISSSPGFSERSLSQFKMFSSEKIMTKKQKKARRRLHNPSEDFFKDY